MSALIRLYPAAWRARYGAEFEELLTERPPALRDLVDIVLGAVDARLTPQVASEHVVRRAQVTDRLAGAAAIAGGLVWSLTYLGGWLLQAEGDLSLPILVAWALMLVSLPGSYLVRYTRAIVVGGLALAFSFGLLSPGVLPWGPMLLVPILGILGVFGPGILALALARAGVRSRDRWWIVLLTTPWPVIGAFVTVAGLVPGAVPLPLVIASFLPLGFAWIATGARIARGTIVHSTSATAGGTA